MAVEGLPSEPEVKAWSNSVDEKSEFNNNPQQRAFQFGEFLEAFRGLSKSWAVEGLKCPRPLTDLKAGTF